MAEPPTLEGLNDVIDEGRLWSEFEDLKSGIGLTPAKLLECPNVMRLLKTSDLATAEERINEVVETMGDNMYAEAFAVALAIQSVPKLEKNTLVGRREALARYLGERRDPLKKKPLDTGTIKSRELKGQEQFIHMAKSMSWGRQFIFEATTPFTPPNEDFVFSHSRFWATIGNGRLFGMETTHYYVHTKSTKAWTTVEYEDMLGREPDPFPLCSSLLIHNAVPKLQRSDFSIHLTFQTAVGEEISDAELSSIEVNRYQSLTDLVAGEGTPIEQPFPRPAGHPYVFEDANPVLGAYYKVDWEYE